MVKTTKTMNGRTVARYTFSAKDKEILSGYIPINLCLSCPAKGRCCGCPKHREYLDWMYVHFGEDLELIHFAENGKIRSKKAGFCPYFSTFLTEFSTGFYHLYSDSKT